MGTKAFSFNSQSKYRTGGHFKETPSLSLANQEIMVDDKGSNFKALFPDIFAHYQNPLLTGDVAMGNKAWQIWQNTLFSWWHCKLNFALWCASAGCGVSFEDHLQAEKPFVPACTPSTSTIRPRACLKSCVSPSQGINLIHVTRMHMTPEPISGFVLSSPFLQGGPRMSSPRRLEYFYDSIWCIWTCACGVRPILPPEGCHAS